MVEIGDNFLSLKEIGKILKSNEEIVLNKNQLKKINQNNTFLREFSKDKIIYGLNTGFGPMAKIKISAEDQIKLQYNLIRSHASGTGRKLSDKEVRAVMISRLNTLMKGYSGIDSSVIELLKEFLNNGVYPVIFAHGSVGASGDLVQLAHLALTLIGEGEVNYHGKIVPTKDVLKKLNLKPVEINSREGLAIINGTSCMTGISLINLIDSKNLLNWSVLASAMLSEIFSSYDDYFSEQLNNVKLHEGQREIAKMISKIISDSKLIKQRKHHYLKDNPEAQKDKVQEYYSLRCTPQILGPVYDTILNAEKVVLNELNSVSDNPIVDQNEKDIFHGGNFHGDYVSLEMDKLKITITRLSMLSERQLNLLLNDNLNDDLPPFINLGKIGLNLGMQGMQFTATSTTAENQTLSYPMYIHSIPTNADNQDIVSMGTNSALITEKVIENSYEVLAIEFIAILQAIDYLKVQNKLSKEAKRVYEIMRKIVPKFIEDTPKYKEIEKIKNYLTENNFA
jgi:histidine ammonia-lyase